MDFNFLSSAVVSGIVFALKGINSEGKIPSQRALGHAKFLFCLWRTAEPKLRRIHIGIIQISRKRLLKFNQI